MIYVIAHLHALPGKGGDVIALSKTLIAETLKEAGCVSYDLYQKPGSPETLVFVETWESREALEAHFQTAHIKAFGQATTTLVETARVEIVHPDRVEVV